MKFWRWPRITRLNIMARPAAPWARVEMFLTGTAGKLFSNVFWFAPTSALSGSFDQAAAATAFYTALVTAIAPVTSHECIFEGCSLIVANGVARTGVDHYGSSPGTNTDTSLPEFYSAIVQKHSAAAGKHGVGRWYFSGIAKGYTDGNYLTSGGITDFTTLATALKANITASTNSFVPQLYSSGLNALNPISYTSPVALLSTSRRRRPKF